MPQDLTSDTHLEASQVSQASGELLQIGSDCHITTLALPLGILIDAGPLRCPHCTDNSNIQNTSVPSSGASC